MAYNYNLWLFKEFKTAYGLAKIEIYRADYAGDALEIENVRADSVILSLSNLSGIASPVGKSQLKFKIIDTGQIDYTQFFTPDARRFKVVLSTRRGVLPYVVRWSGYLTPDSFAENLQYRTDIDLTARDNLGLLNDYAFDLPGILVTVRQVFEAAFKKIDDPYPMEIIYKTAKRTADTLAIDGMVNTFQMLGRTWADVVENLLHDLGLQMRFIDLNRIAIFDLSQLPDLGGEAGPAQDVHFINNSGFRAIQPAWRELALEQDFGVIDNFFRGYISGEDKLNFVKDSDISPNIGLYEPEPLTQWARTGNIFLLNYYNSYNAIVDDSKTKSIYFTGARYGEDEAKADRLVYTQDVPDLYKELKITFRLNNTLRTPLYTTYIRGGGNILWLPYVKTTGRFPVNTASPYAVRCRFNIFLETVDGELLVMRASWEKVPNYEVKEYIQFDLPKLNTKRIFLASQGGQYVNRYSDIDKEEEYTIKINSLPKRGKLKFFVYPFEILEKDNFTDQDLQRSAKIEDLKMTVETETKGAEYKLVINPDHNIREQEKFTFGQVPENAGDFLIYTGGLFNPATQKALANFYLPGKGAETKYNLAELVAREIIHYNKKNYNVLSGSIQYKQSGPVRFDQLITCNGKNYLFKDLTLNVISNTAEISEITEVTPYEDATFSKVEAQISTGTGYGLSGGFNAVMQFSDKPGNAKRIYELDDATPEELLGAFLLVDKPGIPEAKRYKLATILGQIQDLEAFNARLKALEELIAYDAGRNAIQAKLPLYSMGGITAGGPGVAVDPKTLTFDNKPTAGSPNPVTSEAVFRALEDLQRQINQLKNPTK